MHTAQAEQSRAYSQLFVCMQTPCSGCCTYPSPIRHSALVASNGRNTATRKQPSYGGDQSITTMDGDQFVAEVHRPDLKLPVISGR